MPDSATQSAGTSRSALGRHIVLYGGFGYGNTGNEATLAITLDLLREFMPGVRLTVAAPAPEKVEVSHGVSAVAIRPAPRKGGNLPGPFRKLVREADRFAQISDLLGATDCLMIPGTGIFDDFNVTTFECAYPMWQWCRQARRMSVPVKFVSVGAGPIQRPWSRRFFRRAALLADHLSCRDEDSRTFIRDVMKVDVNDVAITPDLVFGMTPAPAAPVSPGPPRAIAIGTMVYHTWSGEEGGADDAYEAYLDKMTAFCRQLLDDGAELRLLTADPGDRPATQALLARLCELSPQVAERVSAPAAITFADICREVAKVDAVVASRFHTIVAAMICARPAVSLGYTPKNSEVMKLFGADGFCQNIWDFDPGLLRRHFAEATARPAEAAAEMTAVRERLHAEVRSHMEGILAEIAARPARARQAQ